MNTYITTPDGKEKPVRNLGWLLRKSSNTVVDRIEVKDSTATSGPDPAHVTVHFQDGYRYDTDFMDKGMVADFFNKKRWRGTPVIWFGKKTKAGSLKERVDMNDIPSMEPIEEDCDIFLAIQELSEQDPSLLAMRLTEATGAEKDAIAKMAKVIYWLAWADGMEDRGKTLRQKDISNAAPKKVPTSALRSATETFKRFKQMNRIKDFGQWLKDTMEPLVGYAPDPEDFGHALGLSAYGYTDGFGEQFYVNSNKLPFKYPHADYSYMDIPDKWFESKRKVKTESLQLSAKDKKVLASFAEQKPAEGKKLSTDGKRLDGLWMGGKKIAWWEKGKVHHRDPSSKAEGAVLNALRKYVPKFDWHEPVKTEGPDKIKVGDWVVPKVSTVQDLGYGIVLDGFIDQKGKPKAFVLWTNLPTGENLGAWDARDLALMGEPSKSDLVKFRKQAEKTLRKQGQEADWDLNFGQPISKAKPYKEATHDGNKAKLRKRNMEESSARPDPRVKDGDDILKLASKRKVYIDFGGKTVAGKPIETDSSRKGIAVIGLIPGGLVSDDKHHYLPGVTTGRKVWTYAGRGYAYEVDYGGGDYGWLTNFVKLKSRDGKHYLDVAKRVVDSGKSDLGMTVDKAKRLLNAAGVKIGESSEEATSIRELAKRFYERTVLQESPPDKAKAAELYDFITNDAQLYRSQHFPTIKNLVKKKAAGKYDSRLARKLFMYLVDDGAKKYHKEFGGGDKWNDVFSKDARLLTADMLAKDFEDSYENGQYDDLIPKKYRKERLLGEVSDIGASHQKKIALKTLKMPNAMVGVMGGMNKKQAVQVLRQQGYSDSKLKALLKKSGHTDEEIRDLLKERKQRQERLLWEASIPPKGTLYVDRSSIFDSRPYRADVYAKALKKAGAKKVWTAPLFGWSNQPDVVLFTGLSEKDAEAALNDLPEFKKWGAIIRDAAYDWKKNQEERLLGEVSDPPVIAQLRDIVKKHQHAKVKHLGKAADVDAFTASAIVKVYDNISPKAQQKYVQFPVPKMADIAFKVLKKERLLDDSSLRRLMEKVRRLGKRKKKLDIKKNRAHRRKRRPGAQRRPGETPKYPKKVTVEIHFDEDGAYAGEIEVPVPKGIMEWDPEVEGWVVTNPKKFAKIIDDKVWDGFDFGAAEPGERVGIHTASIWTDKDDPVFGEVIVQRGKAVGIEPYWSFYNTAPEDDEDEDEDDDWG